MPLLRLPSLLAVGPSAIPAPVPLVLPAARSADVDRRWERIVGIALAAFILLIYLVSNPNRHNFYEHFTWQASAWL